MDNNWNFKTLGTSQPGAMNRLPVITPLSRQGSLYSWTLDQIQNNLGKDCGSMNMEELLMNINGSEETQRMVPTNGANEGLQRQGSTLALPRILSQKTVDEVWKYITEEEHTKIDGGSRNIPQIQRQSTLGDITLQELLSRAGAIGNIHDPSSVPGTNLSVEFQQKPMASHVLNNIVPKSIINHGSYLHPNVNGSTSTYQPRRQQLAFRSGQVNAHGIRDQSHQENNVTLVQSVAPVPGVNTRSPITPFPVLDGIPKIHDGSSLVSPFPYTFSGTNNVRDRKTKNNGIGVEKKVVEKIHRRKIKNRESAARSRARKLTQTMELEAEAEKLRKENQELLKKQAEMSAMQTKLGKEMMIYPSRKQLRRTKSDIQ